MPGCWTSWRRSVKGASPLTLPCGSLIRPSTMSQLLTLLATVTSSRTWSLERPRSVGGLLRFPVLLPFWRGEQLAYTRCVLATGICWHGIGPRAGTAPAPFSAVHVDKDGAWISQLVSVCVRRSDCVRWVLVLLFTASVYSSVDDVSWSVGWWIMWWKWAISHSPVQCVVVVRKIKCYCTVSVVFITLHFNRFLCVLAGYWRVAASVVFSQHRPGCRRQCSPAFCYVCDVCCHCRWAAV